MWLLAAQHWAGTVPALTDGRTGNCFPGIPDYFVKQLIWLSSGSGLKSRRRNGTPRCPRGEATPS